MVSQDIHELFRLRQQEHTSWQEELLDGISAVLLGTEENVQEDELLKALEDKYDALRDKLLLEALEKQMGAAEWAQLSEQERQTRLTKLKLQERRLRQQGRFDDAAALLGEGLKNAETLQVNYRQTSFTIREPTLLNIKGKRRLSTSRAKLLLLLVKLLVTLFKPNCYYECNFS